MSDFGDESADGLDDYEDDFIDDEDVSDEDEDYEGGRGGKSNKRKKLKGTKSKKKQKKKRPSGRDFIQMEAEEEDEEDELSGDDVPEEERREAEKRRAMYEKELKRKNKGPGFLEYDEEEEIEDYFQTHTREEAAEGEEGALLPTNADPKLFVVKCKPGEERLACLQITKKYNESLGTQAEFQIFSAFSIEKSPGYIYIEAYTDKHVYMAIANSTNVFGKITLVSFADRVQIFESDPTKSVQVKPGQWVRVRKGVYEGDLAQVQEVDESKGKVEVILVPRLLPQAETEMVDEDEEHKEEDNKSKKYDHLRVARAVARNKIKPPQKLFNEGEYQGWTSYRDAERGLNFYVYKGNRFYNGLLYKWFPLKNLITQNVNVTYEESKFFTSNENADPEMFSTLINQIGAKATKFFKGDRIKVIKGDLMNLEAEIVKINPTSLIIRPTNYDNLESLEVSPGDCVKSFPKGAYVRIVEGKNAGKEGFVLSIDDNNVATLMSDGLQNVVQAFVNDLVFCNESTRNLDVSSKKDKEAEQEFVKFDLVKLNDRKTVGIVLGTANTGWKILDNFGNVRNVTTYQIEQKLNTRNHMTRNDKSQTLRINDSVRILQGKYKGQTGIIKHIYNDLLFIYNPDVTQNMGVIIEKANNGYLLSSQRTNGPKAVGPKGKDELIGKLCSIKTGPWKGYQGLVKEGNEKTVRLELTAKCQIIDVKRELVVPVSDIGKTPTEVVDGRTLEPKTPMISRFPQSPMFNLNSPGFENSPGWGFESPAYDQHL